MYFIYILRYHKYVLDILLDSVSYTLDNRNMLQIYFLAISFKIYFTHTFITVSTIYKVYYKYLYKIILQEHLQDTLQTPLQSLVQNTLQRKPCCMLQLELQHALQGSYTILLL